MWGVNPEPYPERTSVRLDCTHVCSAAQIWILEKNGGSLVGGSLKLAQERKNNPPPPRNPQLPPKPKVRGSAV